MAEVDLEIPTDISRQQIVGAVFAESSTKHWGGGENDQEKKAIVCAIVNMAFYAKKCPKWNKALGDGTILGAIKQALVAYNKDRWLKVMGADKLLPVAVLKGLAPDDLEHLKLTLNVVKNMQIETAPLRLDDPAAYPVQFNKAANSPPSGRFAFCARIQAHSFYAFIAGRECE